MPTKPLPIGTCNFPVNAPVELRRDVGRLAYAQGKSLGAFTRELWERAVADAYRTGKLVDRIAQRSLEISAVLVAMFGIAAAVLAAAMGDNSQRTARIQRVSRRREDVCEVADVSV